MASVNLENWLVRHVDVIVDDLEAVRRQHLDFWSRFLLSFDSWHRNLRPASDHPFQVRGGHRWARRRCQLHGWARQQTLLSQVVTNRGLTRLINRCQFRRLCYQVESWPGCTRLLRPLQRLLLHWLGCRQDWTEQIWIRNQFIAWRWNFLRLMPVYRQVSRVQHTDLAIIMVAR